MGGSLYYNIQAGFNAVNAWQNTLLKNAQGLLQPGYNKEVLTFGSTGGVTSSPQGATVSSGSRQGATGGSDTLSVARRSIQFEQGDFDSNMGPTQLAVLGSGFFIVAESLKPGAKLYLTRNGDFHYDAQGRLVNSQGLFVMGGSGQLTDPPTPVFDPGNGQVDLTRLTLGKVPNPGSLSISGFGSLIYETNLTSGPIRAFQNGDGEVGFVQPNTLERPSMIQGQAELQVQTAFAQQAYKMFKDMLDSYNKTVDDAIGLIR